MATGGEGAVIAAVGKNRSKAGLSAGLAAAGTSLLGGTLKVFCWAAAR